MIAYDLTCIMKLTLQHYDGFYSPYTIHVCVYVQLLRVGVTVFRYVTISAAACWLITIDKNIRGRGHRQSDSQVASSVMHCLYCLTVLARLQCGIVHFEMVHKNLICLLKLILS